MDAIYSSGDWHGLSLLNSLMAVGSKDLRYSAVLFIHKSLKELFSAVRVFCKRLDMISRDSLVIILLSPIIYWVQTATKNRAVPPLESVYFAAGSENYSLWPKTAESSEHLKTVGRSGQSQHCSGWGWWWITPVIYSLPPTGCWEMTRWQKHDPGGTPPQPQEMNAWCRWQHHQPYAWLINELLQVFKWSQQQA